MLLLILGIIVGCILGILIFKVMAGKLRVKWYQWVLGTLGTVMLLFTIQNYFALINEYHFKAAKATWSVFGLPALVLYALIWIIPFIAGKVGNKAAKASA